VDNLALNTAYSTASSTSEYSEGRSSSFTGALEWTLASRARTLRIPTVELPLLGALGGAALRWNPTLVRLTSSYANVTDRRASFSLPVEARDVDSARTVRGLERLVRNAGVVELRPVPSLTARWDITSLRDLRDYGDTAIAGGRTNVGAVARAERERLLGLDIGLERERQMGLLLSFAPTASPWFRPRVDLGTQYAMLRDPNAPGALQTGDSTGAYRLPRRLSSSQGLGVSATVDLARGLAPHLGGIPLLRRLTSALQPLDVSWRRDLRSAFDGVPFDPGLGYQLGLGGVDAFREQDGRLATSAGVTRSLTASGTVILPLGASLVARYTGATSTAWTRRIAAQSIVETEQRVFPDLSLRWSFQPTAIRGILSSVGMQAGLRRSEGLTFQPTVGEGLDDDAGGSADGGVRDELTSTQYQLTPSLVWAWGGLSTAGGWTRTDRRRVRSGGVTSGRQTDITASVGRSFALPDSWDVQSDLRWSLGFSQSRTTELFDAGGAGAPGAAGDRRRVTDNGRWAINTNADTDVSETMTFSLTLARAVTFDDLYDRRFTQSVLTATLHLRFFAGTLR
jgi:hypothetical protein